ncbi:transcription factor bHLH149-like isoform X2 [Quercus lobata]|nr:transcription factor bHLH149-like isoform X2 [Quercus lobata]
MYIVKLFSSMESTISNPDFNIEEEELKRTKRRKTETRDPESDPKPETIRWRSESEQRNYSSKLVEALRQVRRNSSSSSSSPSSAKLSSSSSVGRHREIRDAANRVLAVSAKGKTRWSRAILTSRLSSKLAHNNTKHKKGANRAGAKVTGCSRLSRPEKKRLPAVQRKVKVLGRLVPGCRKVSLPNLLEEATDYIAALQMQVRAMTKITEILTGAPVNRLGSS